MSSQTVAAEGFGVVYRERLTSPRANMAEHIHMCQSVVGLPCHFNPSGVDRYSCNLWQLYPFRVCTTKGDARNRRRATGCLQVI